MFPCLIGTYKQHANMTEYNNIIQYFTIFLSCGIIYKNHIRGVYISEILDHYYLMQEICKCFGISRDTALRWIDAKICLPIRSGRTGNFIFQKSMNG